MLFHLVEFRGSPHAHEAARTLGSGRFRNFVGLASHFQTITTTLLSITNLINCRKFGGLASHLGAESLLFFEVSGAPSPNSFANFQPQSYSVSENFRHLVGLASHFIGRINKFCSEPRGHLAQFVVLVVHNIFIVNPGISDIWLI